ncbi:hypothetical protein MPER_06914 [Moniliophthora perniciosa FA553]|nr:hypothetical protein MPER_06914 [Moniliophthora perniciosa FA553]
MPPKPALTYAQLIFRAIKALDGKATLQEICNWISQEYEYYRYVEGNAWTSSVRHNLSSGRAFKKMERCGGDRGKGFFWSLDEAHLHTLEEQDARIEHEGGKGKKKEKAGAPLSEPPLKKSVRDVKSAALPPPLTSTPLERKTASKTTPTHAESQPKTSTSGLATAPAPLPVTANMATPAVKSLPLPAAMVPSPSGPITMTTSTTTATTARLPTQQPQIDFTPSIPPALESVVVPIVIGLPPNSNTTVNTTTTKQPPMVLHESKIYLDPEVFKGLNKDMLEALEKLGARQANNRF